ncbi:hypothetical protein [Pseudanabaena minima]|uniref:hypothetical protein n=1 Tax=Pseudanabaena minima TaxID=890415 RepID=UPI003DA9624B
MKKSLFCQMTLSINLAIIAVSCTSNTPITSNTPSTTATATSTATTKPFASASPSTSPSNSPTPSATPSISASESPISTAAPKPDPTSDIVRVAVINNSGKVLKAIYMSAPKKEDWGENELDEPIPDREKADFEWKRSEYKGDEAGCIFDIRAEYNDGKVAELDPIDVCKTPAINLK